MINLILSGGVGSRLWPLSRKLMPKQFNPFLNGESLFERTVKRNLSFCDSICVASNQEQYFLALDLLAANEIKSSFIIEGVGRNTAPPIILSSLNVDGEEIILVSPSDHIIGKEKEYKKAVDEAVSLAKQGKIVTFGIKPNFPETGFGYIETKGNGVLSFKEKPNEKLAKEYIQKGNYYWNSGMFCFKAKTMVEEAQKYAPELLEEAKNIVKKYDNKHKLDISYDDMLKLTSISIDYAIMEKSQKIAVVPCDIDWSDLGSFDSLYDVSYSIGNNNAVLSKEKPILKDSKNNLIISDDRQIALIDVEDLIIVDSADALLISKRGSSQKVKEIVSEVEQVNPNLLYQHHFVKRPWGQFEVLLDSPSCKVKKLEVLPQKKLSLQKHNHRQEHWFVVSGVVDVVIDGVSHVLSSHQSIDIPLGAKHRLENKSLSPAVLIETQTGTYFGEDDIIRFEDDFGRI